MRVLKFGGSSVASAERICEVAAIISHESNHMSRLAVVVSALGGATDDLLSTAKAAASGDIAYRRHYELIYERHISLASSLLGEDRPAALSLLREQLEELRDTLQGIYLLNDLSLPTLDAVLSFGERLSAFIISEHLQNSGLPADVLDARKVVKTDEKFGNAAVDFALTNQLIERWFESCRDIQIVTGFIGATAGGKTTTLGRGGSDYTAAIFAAALGAEELQIWTDVDGVLTADPRQVPKAHTIPLMTYEEALEMSYFGAKVIYPPTMQPVLARSIPVHILNTMNRSGKGTLIGNTAGSERRAVCGISSISDVALLRLQGSGLVGVTGTAMRLFSAMARKAINIILITQASSEHSICFAVDPQFAKRAGEAIEEEFRLEIDSGLVDPLFLERDLSIIAIVGENMRHTPGISGRFFSALGKNGINAMAIAQGSSERNISVVIARADESKALNAVHDAFFLADTRSLNLFIAGTGLIGKTLLKQIEEHRTQLLEERALDIQVVGLTNSRRFYFDEQGMDPAAWESLLENGSNADIRQFVRRILQINLANSIFVDCTASEAVVHCYEALFGARIAIVTPNKKACSGKVEMYNRLQDISRKNGVPFLYETNVGAGLPVLSTLRDLIASGDRIIKIEAVLSGTLSYIFNTFSPVDRFSDVVRQAWRNGYTEPDPRDDLSGLDVARKLLILARESGFNIELEDVAIQNLVPADCIRCDGIERFFTCLADADDHFAALVGQANEAGQRLRYVAGFEAGKAETSLRAVDNRHPFYSLGGSDNMIAFTTLRYREHPLVVKGAGAGADVTAAGVFADIIRIGS